MGTKYYVAKIEELNGEYEYISTIRFCLPATRKPAAFLNRVVKDWYSGAARKENDGYYFNCGEVYVEAGDYKEVPEAAFDALSGIVTDMTDMY